MSSSSSSFSATSSPAASLSTTPSATASSSMDSTPRERSRSRSRSRSRDRILSSQSTPTNADSGSGVTVAIDFGSSVSRVALLRDNRPILIPNTKGQLVTPSIVALPISSSSSSSSAPPSPSLASSSSASSLNSHTHAQGWLVGPEALPLLESESDRIVLNLKRLLTEGCPRMVPILGGKSSLLSPDQKAKYIQQRYGWSSIWTKNGIQFEHKVDGQSKRFTSAEVLTVFFTYLKSTAISFLSASGIPIKQFIVTVPSVFGTLEREWIRDACEEAGLSVLRLLNDSTAAGVAYGVSSGAIKDPTETVVAVLSWGGGVCSCSLVSIDGGIIEVMGTGGDAQIGGEDFTQQLIHHCQEEIHHQFFRELTDPSSIRRLHLACDQAKIELSTYTSAVIELANLDGIDLFRTVVNRSRFEMLCAQDFTRCLAPIQQALAHAKMTTDQVDQVVLVGGSTRIPKVQQIVQQIFGSKVLHLNLERDDTVAHGAALYCSMTNKPDNNFVTDDLLLMDCNPYSLGVNVGTKDALGDGGKVVGMVERNINIPLRKSANFSTSKDNQENIVFRIYEGENLEASKNWFLGEVQLSNLRPGPAGSSGIELSFDIDANEILTVTAEELGTGNKTTQTHKFSANHVKITEETEGHKNEMEMGPGMESGTNMGTERNSNIGVRNV